MPLWHVTLSCLCLLAAAEPLGSCPRSVASSLVQGGYTTLRAASRVREDEEGPAALVDEDGGLGLYHRGLEAKAQRSSEVRLKKGEDKAGSGAPAAEHVPLGPAEPRRPSLHVRAARAIGRLVPDVNALALLHLGKPQALTIVIGIVLGVALLVTLLWVYFYPNPITGSRRETRTASLHLPMNSRSSRRSNSSNNSSRSGSKTPPGLLPLESGQIRLPPRPAEQSDIPSICRELVVPTDSECVLLVPKLAGHGSGGGQVAVTDAKGAPVFRVTFSNPAAKNARTENRLVLANAPGDINYVICRDQALQDGSYGLAIHHGTSKSEKIFGSLRKSVDEEGGGYVITGPAGRVMWFRGDLNSGHVNVTDHKGRLMAMCEPAGNRRSIRIGPLVDAGLVALTIMGMDMLEFLNSTVRVMAA